MKSIGRTLPFSAGLEGIRGVAIGLVLCVHASVPYMGGGFIGVDLFFVLSGFLISRVLIADFSRNHQIDFVTFYYHRFLRIVPPLAFVCVALICAAPFVGIPYAALWPDYFVVLTFVSDYTRASARIPVYLAQTWSLSVEEQFYMLWPTAAFLLMVYARSIRRIVIGLLALAAAVAIWRCYRFSTAINPMAAYDSFDTRFDALCYGSALAFLSADHRRMIARLWPAAVGVFIVTVCAASWNEPWMVFGGYSLVAISAAIIIAAAEGRTSDVFSSVVEFWPLRLLGKISYALYLWHYVPVAIIYASGGKGVGVLAWSIPIGIAGATVSYFLIERPVARFKAINDRRVKMALSLIVPALVVVGVLYVIPYYVAD